MGGVYRDQGLEVVSKWLIPVIKPRVEAAYQYMRNDSIPKAVAYPRVPTAPPPQPATSSSEGVGHALRSHLAQHPNEPQRSLPPRDNVPQQGSGRVGRGVANHPEDIDQSRNRHQRRRSSQGDGRSGDSGKHGTSFAEGALALWLSDPDSLDPQTG